MSQSLYELVALGARYVFAGLMVLIVLRAWRITLIDSRRAGALRRMSPQTGLSGELLVLEGSGKARRGMRYPVIREGMIGSSRRSDIRVRHPSIRRKHAWFQLDEEGLTIRARSGAPMYDGDGRAAQSLELQDGAEFTLGRVRLLLVLSEAPEPATVPRREHRGGAPDWDAPPARRGETADYSDELADPDSLSDPDDLFLDRPARRRPGGDDFL